MLFRSYSPPILWAEGPPLAAFPCVRQPVGDVASRRSRASFPVPGCLARRIHFLLRLGGWRRLAPSRLLSWFSCVGQSPGRLRVSDSSTRAAERASLMVQTLSIACLREAWGSALGKAPQKANPLGAARSVAPSLLAPLPRHRPFQAFSQCCRECPPADPRCRAGGPTHASSLLGVCLLVRGTRVRALVREDPACRGAAGPSGRGC